MNVPPAAPPPPAYVPPPPPAPAKSSPVKWILIGCGAFAFLGILACGGCLAIVYFGAKAIINDAVAKVRPIIASNDSVKSEVGEVRNVTPRWDFRAEKHDGKDTVHFTLDVEGDKGKGTVQVKLYDRGSNKDEFFVTLTFVNEAGNKFTPIGTWRVYDDGKGNAGFEPVTDGPVKKPDDAPKN